MGLAIYRLYLSPLARFPGPKLAALSKWYEAYYEIVLNGKFSFHIEDLHRQYGTRSRSEACMTKSSRAIGPIVRITPEEVHIKDPPFWETLYVKHNKTSKYEVSDSRTMIMKLHSYPADIPIVDGRKVWQQWLRVHDIRPDAASRSTRPTAKHVRMPEQKLVGVLI